MDIEVMTHELDHDEGVYRMVVGQVLYQEVPRQVEVGTEEHPEARARRDDAAALRAQADQVRAEGDEAEVAHQFDEQADQLEAEANDLPEVPVHEVQTDLVRADVVPVEDFVFAADDKRWEGKTPEQVAAAQRKLVSKALADREAAENADRNVQELPGSGQAL